MSERVSSYNTVAELKNEAKRLGITKYYKMNKAELLEKINGFNDIPDIIQDLPITTTIVIPDDPPTITSTIVIPDDPPITSTIVIPDDPYIITTAPQLSAMDEIIAIRRQRYEQSKKVELDAIREQEMANKEVLRKEKIAIWGKKYSRYFTTNKYIKAANIINQFITRKMRWNIPTMIAREIPGIYRFRLVLTTTNKNRYSEDAVDLYDKDIRVHRAIYLSITNNDKEEYIGDYILDIRELFQMRNDPIDIFYLQPKDHERLIKQFALINGETAKSVRFIQSLEYDRSLVRDFNKSMKDPCCLGI